MPNFALHFSDTDGKAYVKLVAADSPQHARDDFLRANKGNGYLIQKVKVSLTPAPMPGDTTLPGDTTDANSLRS